MYPPADRSAGADVRARPPPVGPFVTVRRLRMQRTGSRVGLVLLCGILLLGTLPANVVAQDPWSFERPVRVSEGVTDPVDIAFGRDGYLYYASLAQTEVRRVVALTGELDRAFNVSLEDAYWEPGSETGVFGLEMHPEFASNGVMFVSYSKNESGEWSNVLSRVTLIDATGAHDEEVLMTRPGGMFHNGGRVLVADGYLWWTTGDASDPWMQDPMVSRQMAQEDGNMRGKVLRLTMDGAPARGNAWGDAAYTKGHRNVYGIAWDPEHQRMLVTENGNARRDYLYILESGGNYGWPICEGACDEPDPRYKDPIWQSEGTVAPTGAAWFRGAFWFGTFNKADLMRVSDDTGAWVIEEVHHYPGTEDLPPRMLDVQVGPDGNSLWFSAWSEVWRIDFADDPEHPGVAAIADGPFWWNGTATGERADPPDAPKNALTPAPGSLLGLAVVVAVAWTGTRRRNA